MSEGSSKIYSIKRYYDEEEQERRRLKRDRKLAKSAKGS